MSEIFISLIQSKQASKGRKQKKQELVDIDAL